MIILVPILAIVLIVLSAEQIVRYVSANKLNALYDAVEVVQQRLNASPADATLTELLKSMQADLSKAEKQYNGRCWTGSQYYTDRALKAYKAA